MKEVKFSIEADVAKADTKKNLVFGWASIIEIDGEPLVDTQGHIIEESELEDMMYSFAKDVGIAGDMHQTTEGVGELVEMMVFTKEKQELLGIDLGMVGAWCGFKVSDEEFDKVISGERKMFSIGGTGVLEEVEDEEV